MISSGFIYGASSVIGQTHADLSLLNQDAYMIKEYAFGFILVVADGLGSKPLSDIGSKAACDAVCESARVWGRYEHAPVELLIRLIHTSWELRIAPHSKSDCGTTCLFAILFKSGRLVCGQLGDGIIGYGVNNTFRLVLDKDDDFSNLTQSIHGVRGVSEWTCIEEQTGTESFSILLATDGISEDLVQDKRKDFLVHLQTLIKEQPNAKQRNAAIRYMLTNWSAKHSNDDKTLIVFHRGANNHEDSQ
jgi:serine/threonine protein phosphatase PrpC